jgi:predicted lipid carrier protein YhbT
MATQEQCRKALEDLTGRLSNPDVLERAAKLGEKTLSCRVTDLGVTFVTQLSPQGAEPVTEATEDTPPAQIRVVANSDQIVAIADNPANFAKFWVTGRLRVEGSIKDILQLRRLL